MSMDYERNGSDKPITEQEGVMFAAQPVWERNRKRRGFGGRKTTSAAAPETNIAPMTTVAPEPRSFAADRDDEPMALDTPVTPGAYPRAGYTDMRDTRATPAEAVTTPVSSAPLRNDAAEDAGLVAAIGRPTARGKGTTRSRNMGPAAIAAGVVALGAIGAVGWMASHGDDGVPELSPGQPTESQVAAAPLPPVDMPTAPAAADTAVNPPPAATASAAAAARPAAPARAQPRMAQAPRTRPAATGAETAGVNASATTLPTGPQPYSTLNPGAATPPAVDAPATATTAPTSVAPAEAPAAIPSTPPTLPTETNPPTATPAPATAEPPM
jgi:hypothetical protein